MHCKLSNQVPNVVMHIVVLTVKHCSPTNHYSPCFPCSPINIYTALLSRLVWTLLTNILYYYFHKSDKFIVNPNINFFSHGTYLFPPYEAMMDLGTDLGSSPLILRHGVQMSLFDDQSPTTPLHIFFLIFKYFLILFYLNVYSQKPVWTLIISQVLNASFI